MYSTPASAQISAIAFAWRRAWASDSMTPGPPMKKKESFMESTMESKSQLPNPNEIPTPHSQPGRKPYDLRERTFEFAIRMLHIPATIPKEGAGRLIADQLSR